MTVKLTDVAKKAGVSPTTVSRVLNNYGYLSQKTIDKVQAAMAELDYQPNSMARSLQGKHTQLIGVIFPTVANPFYGELVDKIESTLFKKGYRTILCDSAHDKEKERSYLGMLRANKVDGIIAGAHNLGIQDYEELDLPIVSFDRFLAEGIPIVHSDNYRGGFLATEYLYLHGARKIGILTGRNDSQSPTNDRVQGYTDFLAQKELVPHVFQLNQTTLSTTLKTIEIRTILTNHDLDAFFCTDDLTAILVSNVCRELGLVIGQDLQIIGYDGTKFLQNYFPHLSTIAQPLADLAELLVELLLRRIEDPTTVLEARYALPIKLIQGLEV